MINLLPDTTKKEITQSYRSRQLVVIGLALFVLVISASILLSSIYVYLEASGNYSPAGGNSAESQNNWQADYANLKAEVDEVNRELKLLASAPASDPLVLIGEVINKKPAGIKIRQFSLEKNDKAPTYRLAINGIADSRETLLAFVTILKTDPMFSNLESPLSNLLTEKNVQFGLTLESGSLNATTTKP